MTRQSAILTFTVFMAVLASANAQTDPGGYGDSTRRSLIALYVAHGALQMLDAASTLRAVNSGQAREANPLMQPLVSHPPAFIAVKAGVGIGMIYGIHCYSKRHPRAAIVLMLAINGGYLYIVQRNFRMSRGVNQMQTGYR